MKPVGPWIALLISLFLLVWFKEVWMIAFLGVLFGVVLSFPVRFLSRWMHRGVAVLMTLLLFGGVFGTGAYLGLQPIADEVGRLADAAPQAASKAKEWLHRNKGTAAVKELSGTGEMHLERKTGDWMSELLMKTGEITLGIGFGLSMIVITIVLGAFFALEPKAYYSGIATLLPRRHEADLRELWMRLSVGLSHWMVAILLSMIIMGVICSIGLWIAGIHDWLLLGSITFIGTFIPYVGALTSAIPGLIYGLAESSDKFLAAALVYLVVHVVEGYIVEPIIMKKAVVIRPAHLLLWQLTMGIFGGVLGIVIATPLLVCVKILVSYLYIEKKIGKPPIEV